MENHRPKLQSNSNTSTRTYSFTLQRFLQLHQAHKRKEMVKPSKYHLEVLAKWLVIFRHLFHKSKPFTQSKAIFKDPFYPISVEVCFLFSFTFLVDKRNEGNYYLQLQSLLWISFRDFPPNWYLPTPWRTFNAHKKYELQVLRFYARSTYIKHITNRWAWDM